MGVNSVFAKKRTTIKGLIQRSMSKQINTNNAILFQPLQTYEYENVDQAHAGSVQCCYYEFDQKMKILQTFETLSPIFL